MDIRAMDPIIVRALFLITVFIRRISKTVRVSFSFSELFVRFRTYVENVVYCLQTHNVARRSKGEREIEERTGKYSVRLWKTALLDQWRYRCYRQ